MNKLVNFLPQEIGTVESFRRSHIILRSWDH